MVADSESPQNSPSARLSGSQYPRTGLSCGGRETARQQQSTVARDWQGEGDKARFLRQVRDAACKAFNVTLGPEYNAAHHDHFHVDMGGFGMCR